jgi:hypothetical protein
MAAMPAQRSQPKPWPMKWIVLVIVVCLGAYTYLTLHYRKQNPSFQPYEDMKSRANTLRLLSAGFQRVNVSAQRPADPMPVPGGAGINPAPGGLPESLRVTLVEPPQLPGDYPRVTAAASANTLLPYPIQFTCAVGDNHQQLAGAQLYLREDQVYVVPEFEKLDGELLARSRESVVLITVPAGVLKPGQYQVSLVGARASRTWALQVH